MDTRTADELNVPQQKTSWLEFAKAHFRDYGMLLSLLVIMLFFQVVTDGTLLRPLNLTCRSAPSSASSEVLPP